MPPLGAEAYNPTERGPTDLRNILRNTRQRMADILRDHDGKILARSVIATYPVNPKKPRGERAEAWLENSDQWVSLMVTKASPDTYEIIEPIAYEHFSLNESGRLCLNSDYKKLSQSETIKLMGEVSDTLDLIEAQKAIT